MLWQHTLLKSNFGLIRQCCSPHASISCKTLANSFYSSTGALKMNNEHTGSGQGTLSPSTAKVSTIIITVCTQSGRVLSYSLSQSSEETREFGTDFPPGQDSPNIQYQHSSKPSLYFHWRDKTRGGRRDAVIMAVVLIMLRSYLAIKLRGDSVWEWKWLSPQKKNLSSFQLSFLIQATQLPHITGTFLNFSRVDD